MSGHCHCAGSFQEGRLRERDGWGLLLQSTTLRGQDRAALGFGDQLGQRDPSPGRRGLPLASRRHRVRCQHSSVPKTRPSPGPSALSPFLHTAWQGRPDRHTRRLPSGHPGPAPHTRSQTMSSADPQLEAGPGWMGRADAPDCLPLAKLVKFKAPPGPAPPRKWGTEAATEHSACHC